MKDRGCKSLRFSIMAAIFGRHRGQNSVRKAKRGNRCLAGPSNKKQNTPPPISHPGGNARAMPAVTGLRREMTLALSSRSVAFLGLYGLFVSSCPASAVPCASKLVRLVNQDSGTLSIKRVEFFSSLPPIAGSKNARIPPHRSTSLPCCDICTELSLHPASPCQGR